MKTDRAARKLARTEAAIETLILDNCRLASGRWAGGDNRVTVQTGSATVDSRVYTEWSKNGKWSGSSVTHTVTVPATWIERVQRRRLQVLDGMVTLDATVADRRSDCTVYAATWVRQSRGCSLAATTGWIATDGACHYHSQTSADAAARGLQRKLDQSRLSPADIAAIRDDRVRAREQRRAAEHAEIIERLTSGDLGPLAEVTVTLRDSHRAGNCAEGTRHFRDRLFGDSRESATVAEMMGAVGEIAADLSRDFDERGVVAAIACAVRRHRRA